MIHPPTKTALSADEHVCNVYCKKNRHADLAMCNTPLSLKEVKEFCEYMRNDLEILNVSEAPEAPEYSISGYGPFKYRWLIVWENKRP